MSIWFFMFPNWDAKQTLLWKYKFIFSTQVPSHGSRTDRSWYDCSPGRSARAIRRHSRGTVVCAIFSGRNMKISIWKLMWSIATTVGAKASVRSESEDDNIFMNLIRACLSFWDLSFANNIAPLPAVPSRAYSSALCVCGFPVVQILKNKCCMASSSSRTQVPRTKDPSWLGDQTKHFTLDRDWVLNNSVAEKKQKHIVLLWLAHNTTLRKEFKKNKLANIRLRAVPVDDWVSPGRRPVFKDWPRTETDHVSSFWQRKLQRVEAKRRGLEVSEGRFTKKKRSRVTFS